MGFAWTLSISLWQFVFRYGNMIFRLAIVLHIFIEFALFVLPVVIPLS